MANCIYKYKGKEYTKEEFYSLVSSSNFVQQEQAKKFTELQERLNNKEFLEGAKNVYESTPDLQQFGTQEQYNDYIARVSLGIIKNPTSGEYNNSKVKDIVYHKTSSKEIEGGKFKISRLGGVYFSFFNVPSGGLIKGLIQKLIKENTVVALVDIKNPFIVNKNNAKEIIKKIGLTTQDVTKLRNNFDLSNNDAILGFPNETKDTGQLDNFPTISFNEKDRKDIIELAVFKPEQIHILGSKQDIEGFKNFLAKQTEQIIPKEKKKSYMKVSSPRVSLTSNIPGTIQDFKKAVGLIRKEINTANQAKINKKIRDYNTKNGTSYYVKYKQLGQSSLVTYEILNKSMLDMNFDADKLSNDLNLEKDCK